MSSSSFQSAQPFRTHCDCGIPVAKLQSWTSKNPGRRFAICKFRNIERGLRGCGYWEWIDENMVEWQRCLINQLLLEKKLLEKEKEVLKAELCNVQDQKTNLVRDLDTIRLKVKHLAAEKKLKVKKKQGSGCFSIWWVLVAAFVIVAIFMVVSIFLWLAVAI